MKTCTSCGRSVDDHDGLELTDGSFYCQSGGCQTRFLNGVYEEKVKPDLMKQNQEIFSRVEPGVCDVCNGKIAAPDGFLLTTRQVVSTPAYWQHYYRYHQSEFTGLGVHSFADFCSNPLLRPACIQTIGGQRTPWMVCATCIAMFPVDREQTRSYARQWWQDKSFQLPGVGPSSAADVNMGAGVNLPSSGKPATPLDFLPKKKKWQFWKK